jgi:hypothetical protein
MKGREGKTRVTPSTFIYLYEKRAIPTSVFLGGETCMQIFQPNLSASDDKETFNYIDTRSTTTRASMF